MLTDHCVACLCQQFGHWASTMPSKATDFESKFLEWLIPTESCFAINTYSPSMFVWIPWTFLTPCRTQHAWNHAMQGILALHYQPRIGNSDIFHEWTLNQANNMPAWNLKPLQAPVSFEFITKDILFQSQRPILVNQDLVFMKECCYKQTWAAPNSKKCAAHIAYIFHDHWIISYKICSFLIIGNCTHFLSRFFEALSNILRKNLPPTTVYHPQT